MHSLVFTILILYLGKKVFIVSRSLLKMSHVLMTLGVQIVLTLLPASLSLKD